MPGRRRCGVPRRCRSRHARTVPRSAGPARHLAIDADTGAVQVELANVPAQTCNSADLIHPARAAGDSIQLVRRANASGPPAAAAGAGLVGAGVTGRHWRITAMNPPRCRGAGSGVSEDLDRRADGRLVVPVSASPVSIVAGARRRCGVVEIDGESRDFVAAAAPARPNGSPPRAWPTITACARARASVDAEQDDDLSLWDRPEVQAEHVRRIGTTARSRS